MIVEEGDPLGGFHFFAEGIKKRICLDAENNTNSQNQKNKNERPHKVRKVNGINDFLDINKGEPFLLFCLNVCFLLIFLIDKDLHRNQGYIPQALSVIYS